MRLATPDGPGKRPVERHPEHEVANEHHKDAHYMRKHYVDQNEQRCQQQNRNHGRPLGNAKGKELMVDMDTVGKERAVAAQNAVGEHSEYVETWNGNRREGKHHYIGGVDRIERYTGHSHRHEGEQQSDGKRPGIAHEDFFSA